MNLSGMVDLSQVNLDDIGYALEFNLGDMLSHLDITMKPGGMEKMIQILNEGYSEYVKSHPEADYSTLGEHFSEYLTTDDAKNIIRKYLGSILQQNGDVVITTAQMQNLITRVMTGMQSYVQGKAEISADYFGEYLQEYLQTSEAKQIMTNWANGGVWSSYV